VAVRGSLQTRWDPGALAFDAQGRLGERLAESGGSASESHMSPVISSSYLEHESAAVRAGNTAALDKVVMALCGALGRQSKSILIRCPPRRVRGRVGAAERVRRSAEIDPPFREFHPLKSWQILGEWIAKLLFERSYASLLSFDPPLARFHPL
jgi:hypothetical protein